MTARAFLFDDERARRWLPFTVTRPAGELLFGTETLRARSERVFGLRFVAHITRAALVGFEEEGSPPCLADGAVGSDGDRIFLSSRFVPQERETLPSCDEATVFVAFDSTAACEEVVGAWLPDGTPTPPSLLAMREEGWPKVQLQGQILDDLWELQDHNPGQIRRDASYRFENVSLPGGVHRLGDGLVSLGAGAEVEPGVFVDARNGPVILAAGTSVHGPARLTGPLYLGPGSVILGGAIGVSSIGPVCKVRGEVDTSIILGFTNKAHDGLLTCSVLGRWVNLGAGTITSDLKNNYSDVRALIRGDTIDTGRIKVGALLGDHVRTGIGTLLTTGAVVEAGSNLFGGGVSPRYLPPFSWASHGNYAEYGIDSFLVTAEVMMARRKVELNEGMKRLYRRAHRETAPLRKGRGS